MGENDIKFEKHFSPCRCKGKIKECRFCGGTGKYHQGYYLIVNKMCFYVETIK